MRMVVFLVLMGPGIVLMWLFAAFFMFPLAIFFCWMDRCEWPVSQAAEFAFGAPIGLWEMRP